MNYDTKTENKAKNMNFAVKIASDVWGSKDNMKLNMTIFQVIEYLQYHGAMSNEYSQMKVQEQMTEYNPPKQHSSFHPFLSSSSSASSSIPPSSSSTPYVGRSNVEMKEYPSDDIIDFFSTDSYSEKITVEMKQHDVDPSNSEIKECNSLDELPKNVDDVSTKSEGKKKKTTKKTKRQKSSTSYNFFCKKFMPIIKKANPNISKEELCREVGRMWRDDYGEESKRKEFEELAQEDKKMFENSEGKKRKRKTKKKSGCDTKPKKMRNSFIYFSKDEKIRNDVKKTNPKMNSNELAKELGRKWREEYRDNPSKRKKYVDMAKADRERYEKEKNEYNSSASDSD